MTLIEWFARQVARRLAPSVFRDADRYERMRNQMQMDRQWLAHDFPEIGAFAERALANDQNYWRSLDDQPVETRWNSRIDSFREQLRRGEARRQPTTAA